MKKRILAGLVISLVIVLQIIWLTRYYKLKVDIYCEEFEKALFDCNVNLYNQNITYYVDCAGENATKSNVLLDEMAREQVKILQSLESNKLNHPIKVIQNDTVITTMDDSYFINIFIDKFAKKFKKEWDGEVVFFPAGDDYVESINKGYYYSDIIQVLYPFNILMQAKIKIPTKDIILKMMPVIILAMSVLIVFIITYLILNKLYVEQKYLNQQKDMFIFQMSHDFRLPLAVIKSVLNNIELKYREDREVHKVTGICNDTIDNLDEMINSILTMSDMTKRLELTINVDIKDIITLIKKAHEEVRLHKEVKLIINPIELDKKFKIKKILLRQVIANLFYNAVKYCDGDPEIIVNFTPLDKGLKILITDNGVGIPEEDKNYIFEDFYRVTKFSTVNGTGLGLYIAKEFIKLMKGDLILESSSPQGSTFVIYLPYTIN